MPTAAQFLLTIGAMLLLGLATDLLGRKTLLPRVTLLLIFGIVIGKEGFDLVPTVFTNNFEIIADMTLLMIGFLLGGKLTRQFLASSVDQILSVSIVTALITTLTVTLLLFVLGVPIEMAIILGCIASATDAAATLDLVLESNHQGKFPNLLLAIVALDDAWALIIFSLGLAIVGILSGHHGQTDIFIDVFRDIGGAILLGLIIGTPAAYLTGRIKPGQPILMEAVGLVFFCGGLAIWLEVSFLITSIVMGSVIANLERHHEHAFHEIENIEWPFMTIFFVLAGATLELQHLETVGWIGLTFIIARSIGKISGGWLGGQLGGAPHSVNRWIGVAMLPQAGVAIGMALVASNYYPQYQQTVLSVVIGSTVWFELIGPLGAKLALKKTRST